MGTLNRKMKQRRGPAADWIGVVPHDGEVIYETDTGYVRIGDGIANAEDLPILNKANAVPVFDSRVAKTGAYTVVAADRGKLIDATSGTWTLALTAAATLGAGFAFALFNSGSGVITIDPNGAETIRDAFGSVATRDLAQGEGGIIVCDGTGFIFLNTTAGNATLSSLGAIFGSREALTGAYTALTTDLGKLFDATSGTFTFGLTAAATLGSGWNCALFNSGSGLVTIDANSTETIRDAAGSAITKTLAQGEGGILVCDGTGFLLIKTQATPTLASLAGMINARNAKTGAYTAVAADRGTIIEATSGTWTLSLTAAATLGNAWACIVANVGSGVITIDPNGAETIRDFAGSATTKTLAQGESGILYCDGTGFFLLKADVPAIVTLASLGAMFNSRAAKTGAYTVLAADKGVLIDATSGTWTLSLTAAATLGDGFFFPVFNSGSGTITIDPNGSETIRDATSSATTKTLAQGEGGIIFCNGTDFYFFKVTAGGGGVGSKTIKVFLAKDGEPDITLGFPNLTYINNIPLLNWDPAGASTTRHVAFFQYKIPEGVSTANGLRVIGKFRCTATSGTVAMKSYFGKMDGVDLDADSFGTVKTSSAASANGTAGILTSFTNDHSSSEIDGLAAGDSFRLKIELLGSDQSITAGAFIIDVEVQSR